MQLSTTLTTPFIMFTGVLSNRGVINRYSIATKNESGRLLTATPVYTITFANLPFRLTSAISHLSAAARSSNPATANHPPVTSPVHVSSQTSPSCSPPASSPPVTTTKAC